MASKAIAGGDEVRLEPLDGSRRARRRSRREGYLTHPHTSAGRVPTDAGYRLYADALLAAPPLPGPARGGLDLSRMRREVDEAMRATTTALSQITDLVALATAPPASSSQSTGSRSCCCSRGS